MPVFENLYMDFGRWSSVFCACVMINFTPKLNFADLLVRDSRLLGAENVGYPFELPLIDSVHAIRLSSLMNTLEMEIFHIQWKPGCFRSEISSSWRDDALRAFFIQSPRITLHSTHFPDSVTPEQRIPTQINVTLWTFDRKEFRILKHQFCSVFCEKFSSWRAVLCLKKKFIIYSESKTMNGIMILFFCSIGYFSFLIYRFYAF